MVFLKIVDILRKVNLQKRLFITFVLSIILPLIIIDIVYYAVSYKSLEDITFSYSKLYMGKAKQNIDYVFTAYKKQIYNIETDFEVVNIIKDYGAANDIEKADLYKKLVGKVKSIFRDEKYAVSLEILDNKGSIAYFPYKIYANDLTKSALYNTLMKSDEAISWTIADGVENKDSALSYQSKKKRVIVSAKVKDFYSGKIIGLISIIFDEEAFSTFFKDDANSNISYMYLSEDSGRSIELMKGSLSVPENFGDGDMKKINADIDLKIKSGDPEMNFFYHPNKVRLYTSYAVSDLTGWKIVALIDYNHIMEKINSTKYNILFIGLFCLIFILPLSYIVTKSVTNPTFKIMDSMKIIQKGDFNVRIEDRGNDELSFLSGSFNNMADKIKSLITEVYDVGLKKSQAEFKALQAQINPHFLYNTLDSINWMAYISNNRDISVMVNLLSKFFRLSLNGGAEFYTIADEIEHVRSYVQIQTIRLNGMVKFNFEASEESLGCITIKILLQPLVENAIVHGISPKGGNGSIHIIVRKVMDNIVMDVADDGVGMEFDASGGIVSRGNKNSSNYGIKNIDERIKITYGAGYGLVLENNENGGVTARVTIPAYTRPDLY